MTGPTRPADDLRERIAEVVFDTLDEKQRDRDVLPIHTSSDVKAVADAVLECFPADVTEAHTRNANLRSEYRIVSGLLRGVARRATLERARARQISLDAKQLRENWAACRQANETAIGTIANLNRAVSRLPGGNTPADAEEQIARRIADYWQGVRGVSEPDDSDYGVAHAVHELISSPGWGSAVTTPEPAAEACPETSRQPVTGVPLVCELTAGHAWAHQCRRNYWLTPPAGAAVPAPADTEEQFTSAIPTGIDEVIGARSKRTWHRRPDDCWMALERPGDQLRLVSERSLFALEGSVVPSSSAGGGDTATEEREDAEDRKHHATFNPKLAGGAP